MIDLSTIPSDRWWGRLVRAPLSLLPDGAVVPVLQGTGRGLRWIVGSANHGCWLGSYEPRQTTSFASLVEAGDVVYDLGAHVGWYTLIASRLVGSDGRVIAFEPLPENVEFLERHLALNEVENVTVLSVAVSDSSGGAPFRRSRNRFQGRLSQAAEADLTVPTVTLDELVESGELTPPDVVKIDVEGAEGAVLNGAKEVLSSSRPTVFLSTHGAEAKERSMRLLRAFGYALESVTGSGVQDDDVLLARPD